LVGSDLHGVAVIPAATAPGGMRMAQCEAGRPGCVVLEWNGKTRPRRNSCRHLHGHERGLDSNAKRLLLPKNW